VFEALGEGQHYADPQADVAFGDIFEAPFLRDIFARDDTTLMGGGPLPPTLAPKVGSWMNTQLEQGTIELYSPSFTPKPADRFALANAAFLVDEQSHRAILISDSCLTATALAQARQKRSVGGRLLFAPLGVTDEKKWQDLVETEDFERFPLPPDERLPAWTVAELGNCFMVDARDVKKHTAARIVSLGTKLAEELEVHWNAYATRRGPHAYSRNTFKLASLLSGGGQPGKDEERVADAIAYVLDCAWALEGSDLEDVSEAEESVRLASGDAAMLTPSLVERLVERLSELVQLARTAADGLEPYGEP
jgi:hypothetical protein